MDLNKFFTTLYRWTSIKLLVGIFLIAASYAFLVTFFVISDSWATPLVLSPAQTRVLSFQPQIAALQAALNKQYVELVTAQAMEKAIKEQSTQVDLLLDRHNGAILSESEQLASTSRSINSALSRKQADIRQTDRALADAKTLLNRVDQELAAKLITTDQAVSRKIAIQASINAATDAKTQAIQLADQSRQMQAGSETLAGGSSSLIAMSSVKQSIELQTLKAQLEIQLFTATATAKALQESIDENKRVLLVAQSSPYFRALTESVNVAFVPYENFQGIKVGDKVYDCYLQVILCREVGVVTTLYDAEEYARHPLFKTDLKGRLIEVKFTKPEAAESQVVFIGGKPLLI